MSTSQWHATDPSDKPLVVDPSRMSLSKRAICIVLGAAILQACDPAPLTPTSSAATATAPVTGALSSATPSPAATAQAIDIQWNLGTFPDSANARISAITAGGPGFVAVGVALGDGRPGRLRTRSGPPPTATSWSRVADSGLDGDFMHSVSVLPDGTLIASTGTGASCPAPPEPSRALWQSRDGLHWTPSTFPAALGCPIAFAANSGIAVGVGYGVEAPKTHDVSGAMWWSDDNGQSWEPAAARN